MSSIDTVICLHGFWWHSTGMYLIKRHLEKEYGLRTLLFNYPSVSGTLDENADSLARFIEDKALTATHILGHSLGGVVALRMLANDPDTVPGRIVCLGSPLSGSRAAEFLSRQNWAEPIVGHSLLQGVVHTAANDWAGDVCRRRDVGVIAGSIPVGVGYIAGPFGEPNDGTVAVSETRLDGAHDHIVMPVSHMGMLLSRRVVDQAAAFLKRGRFLRDGG